MLSALGPGVRSAWLGRDFTIGKTGASGSGKTPEQSAQPDAPAATARRLQPALSPLPVHTSITLPATIGSTPIATAKSASTVETPVALLADSSCARCALWQASTNASAPRSGTVNAHRFMIHTGRLIFRGCWHGAQFLNFATLQEISRPWPQQAVVGFRGNSRPDAGAARREVPIREVDGQPCLNYNLLPRRPAKLVTMTAKQDLDLLSLEREFTDYALAQAHPLVRAWRGDQLRIDIREATKALVALIADDDAACKYADTMKVLAPPPEQFKMRLVEIEGHRFLAQIDFQILLPRYRLWRSSGASTPLGAIADASVLRRLAHEFAVFAPRRIRFLPARARAD